MNMNLTFLKFSYYTKHKGKIIEKKHLYVKDYEKQKFDAQNGGNYP